MLTSPGSSRSRFFVICTLLITVALVFGSFLPIGAMVLRDASNAASGVGYRGWSFLYDVAKRITDRSQIRPDPSGVRPREVPSRAEREATVATIQTNPEDEITLQSRQPMWFSAIPLDSSGTTIQGLTAQWESNNKQVIFIKKNGEAMAGKPGTATVVARAGNKQRSVRVTVVQGTNHRFGGKKTTDSMRQRAAINGAGPSANSTLVARGINAKRKRAHATSARLSKVPSTPFFMRDPTDDPLPDNETSSLYQPANLIGTPPGKKKPGALTAGSAIGTSESGNKNFLFGLPVVGLNGRGIDVALALIYNSLVYNKSTNPSDQSTWLTYDVDSGYPAQGFRLGYGQIEDQGSAGFTLTEANGTRRALAYTTTNTYDTNDGSFIRFIGGSGWGTLYYSDGTQVSYGAAGTGGLRSYPTRITDRNGNYILISYRNSVGPRIDTVQDTMGRYVRFYYDSNNDLVTVTIPGLTGQSDIQVMRFYYENLSLTTSGLFSSSVNVDLPTSGNARVIRYIYLPASAEGSSSSDGDCGYRFDYSPYGMIYQVVKFRGMTASTTSTSSTGTVTEGTNTTAATTTYDYPTSASSLTDVPTFAHRTDDWAGRTTSSAPQYTFAVSEPTGETVSTVTAPDGTVTETHAIRNTTWNNGFISEVRVQNATPTVFAKTVIDWEQNSSNGTARVASVRVTNEAAKTRAIVYTYDTATAYNNVAQVSERGFTTDGSSSSTELRRTTTDFVTSSSYLNRRLLHLPSVVKIFPGNSTTPAARVDYAYDNYGTSHANLTSRDDIIMHDVAFDPFQEPQETWDWVCTQWGWPEEGPYGCLNWEWQMVGYYNPYDANTDYRGNVTSVTTYPDATSTSNTITHGTTYDIAGNVITAQVDCCQQKSFTFTDAYEYAYATSVTNGNPNGLHLTNSVSYDFNTGLVATTTDANSEITSVAYNIDTLRPDHVDFADGGRVSYDYGDNLVADSASKYHLRLTTTTKLDASRYVDSKRYFDGRGALTTAFDSYTSGDGWSITDIQYDSMGRAYRASNPYFSTSDYGTVSINSAGIWTTRSFDNLGRVREVTMPRGDDANPTYTTASQTTYEGEVITVTDQAGKQRRSVTDALGRLIELHEPNSSNQLGSVSSPNQKTDYLYDALDNLVKITQGSQNRYFKYDSLSRLIREKQLEEDYNSSYNLSDSLTNNSYWSRKFEYNAHGLITHAYDPNGYDTAYDYDGLNRLTLINYGDSTPDAHYYYDSQTLPSGAPSYTHGSANGRLIALTYGSGSAGTYFGYDTMGRVNVQKQVTGSNTYSLSYGYNLAGLLTSETYPTNRVLSYAYDNAGRLSQLSDGTTTFANNYAYAATGAMLSETWGNSAVHSIAYNNALQVSQIKLKQSSSGSELQRYDYLYGTVTQSNGSVDKSKNNGQIGRIDGTINGSSTKEWDQRFSYDELGRLSTAAEYQQGTGSTPTWQQAFTYDPFGNRFQSGSSNIGIGIGIDVVTNDISTSTNRFISSGSTPVAYDHAGNITQDLKFRFMNYTYDANGRQLTASSTNNAASQTSIYDAAGQRVQTTANSVTRTMVYDIFGQLVADYNGTTLQRENIYRGRQLLAVYEASSSCYKSITDFVTAFYQGALSRDPTSTELTQWSNTLSQAQARGHAHLIAAAQSLGATIFTSSEYSNLNTTDGQFVTDLYEAYVQRTPDSGGYNAWVAALASNSRTVVRNGFAYSTEFQSNVVQLCASTGTSASLKYVLGDVQGSARVVMENNGTSSAILTRHDYLPFGEEIWAGVGLRTTTQKYANTDNVRQGFALTERDETSGLDHTWFRKYESSSGRWTSPDALSGSLSDPQSFNRYSYVGNDPINFLDALGLDKSGINPGTDGKEPIGPGTVSVDIIFGTEEMIPVTWGERLPGGPNIGPDIGGGPGGAPVSGPAGPGAVGKAASQPDPCAQFLPAEKPPGVNVDEKMKEASHLYTTRPLRDLGETGARGTEWAVLWLAFYDKVRSHGEWDYKWLDKEGIDRTGRSKYEEFGNFIFGATGMAAGFTQGALFRGASLAQSRDPDPAVRAKGSGVPVNSWAEIFSNKGTYPFGDELSDAEAIGRGIAYANCRRTNPL